MSYANAPREKLAIAFQLINLRSLPASGYAIATDFLRLGRLRCDFFFSPISDECYTYYKTNAEFQLEIPWKRGAEIIEIT
ncbi:MAG: hypothetical protein V7K71_17190 [Nostoc sp.]|uniref:hypothetical protein n=1 Tax=Nostoc sp. TaxID=1180 RepID=UPI002FF76FEC